MLPEATVEEEVGAEAVGEEVLRPVRRARRQGDGLGGAQQWGGGGATSGRRGNLDGRVAASCEQATEASGSTINSI
jgi:hypothetical protein